jgi:hypothetical protein
MAVSGVPANRVGQVVQDFVDNGEAVVTATQEGGGSTYTVSAGSAARSTTKSATRGFIDFESRNVSRHARGKRPRRAKSSK